jgi:gliding motility-associated-like protein
MRILFLFSFLLSGSAVLCQICPNPGQNPASAFPVCGSSVFEQQTVPLCDGSVIPTPYCRSYPYYDVNPYWYKFTCFQSGTLGFLITPRNIQDDYDWQLFDVTGRNVNDVYRDGSLGIGSNWSGEGGLTGASSAGTNLFVCGGPGQPLFSRMPELISGHDYLLMVSHFTNTQSGYSLEFKGGTAVITDPKPPAMQQAAINCGGDRIRLRLNKKMKCSSIASDGSDFMISPGNIRVVKSTGSGCSSGFDTDALELTLSQALPVGDYSLVAVKGIDGNTVMDNCGVEIPVGQSVNFTVVPNAPTPMDSLETLTCATGTLHLVFRKPIRCATIAGNGSDFKINGSYPVQVLKAAGDCKDGLTQDIILYLDKPLQVSGSFSLVLQRGVDGNTLLDECNEETPAGSVLDFSVRDTVNAQFSYSIQYGCEKDLVSYNHPGQNGVNSWKWDLADNFRSNEQHPEVAYKLFRDKEVMLIVSNGFCSDTSRQTIVLENYLKADFEVTEDNCPLEPVQFTDRSEGKIVSYSWDLGEGERTTDPSPSRSYPRDQRIKTYTVLFKVTDQWGCSSIMEKSIKVYPSCNIDVPNAFTPNNDNINELLHPLNAVKARQLQFRVYNRWGVLLYETNNWKAGWDGTYNNIPQSSGLYVWTLQYVDADSGKLFQRKGSVMLLR